MRALSYLTCVALLAGIALMGCQKAEEASAEPVITQTTCPVMGNPIDKSIFVEHEGRKVYLCCQACVAKFKAEPEKYLLKLPAMEGTGVKCATCEKEGEACETCTAAGKGGTCMKSGGTCETCTMKKAECAACKGAGETCEKCKAAAGTCEMCKKADGMCERCKIAKANCHMCGKPKADCACKM